jgi:cell wall-associated NlpC family hydrolase
MRLILLSIAAASITMTACASTGGVPEPFPTPGPRPTRTATPKPVATSGTSLPADGYSIAGTALGLRGAPYRNGGSDPRGFDCSGLIEYVYGQHGIAVPRTVEELHNAGTDVTTQDIQPGDLVFFDTTGRGPSHVGMSIGGDEFVHAPSGAGVVRVERLGAAYWAQRFIGVKRLTP